MIKISAVICTYNRAEYLRKAVRSLLSQNLPPTYYEILIIDNTSTDQTRAIIEKEFPQVRYFYEPVQGLSQARNTGWKNAEGEYVAYLDDDAIAAPDWLEKILSVFENQKSNLGCVGGKVLPIWEGQRSAWLSDDMLGQLSIVDWGETPQILDSKRWLAGASIAFPKQLLKDVDGFRTDIGRTGSKLLSMEEIVMRQEIEKRGFACFYHPGIVVHHHISAARLTTKWFIERAYWQGVSDGLIQMKDNLPGFGRFCKGFTTLLRILLKPKELMTLLGNPQDTETIKRKCSVMARVGHALCLWGIVK